CPPRTPTSACIRGAPVPSTTSPCSRTRSRASGPPLREAQAVSSRQRTRRRRLTGPTLPRTRSPVASGLPDRHEPPGNHGTPEASGGKLKRGGRWQIIAAEDLIAPSEGASGGRATSGGSRRSADPHAELGDPNRTVFPEGRVSRPSRTSDSG